MIAALATFYCISFGIILGFSVLYMLVRYWPVTLALVVIAWACVGCGAGGPAQAQGYRSVTGSEEQAALALETLDVFRNLVDVDPDRIDLVFADTWEQQRDACHGFAACTDPLSNGYRVTTYWPPAWDESHPQLLAHELCHVYYYQTHESGDPTHSHIECFDRNTGFAAETAMIVAKNWGGQS